MKTIEEAIESEVFWMKFWSIFSITLFVLIIGGNIIRWMLR